MDADILIDYPQALFSYMREIRKPVFHNSNIFLRDVQCAIQDYFEDNTGEVIKNAEIEAVTNDVIRGLEAKGILRKVNPQGYLVNYPDMATGKDGTKGPIQLGSKGVVAMPPPAAAAAASAAVPVAPKATPPPPMKAASAPAAAPAATGAAPAGAKAPPPWLKK